MTIVRITSVDAPLNRAALLPAAMGLVKRAAGVGLLADRPPIEKLDLSLIHEIAREASSVGVGQDAATALMNTPATGWRKLADLIPKLDMALVESPVPDRELRGLLDVYDYDGLAALVGVSRPSLRRYVAAQRAVPDVVAARLHFVALVTSNLIGSYNDFGVRRWWDRQRSTLDGRSPREALGSSWSPDDGPAKTVADLAASLADHVAS